MLTLADAAVETARQGGREKIESELIAHLEKVNSELVACQKLQLFCVVKEPWLPENGFLTPTMKIKRPTLHEAYGPQYAGWYAKNSPVVWAE